jgi:glycine/D-amino acid oxidase-like deaminating enzyme
VQSKIDYLIVGQGLAGSLLGCLLEMSGLDVLFVDDAHRTSASISAAGIMNPITGKRLNRPHLIDDLLDTALRIYPQINMTLGASFFQERTVLRLLQSETEAKQWKLRLASGDYGKYVNSHLPEQIGPFGGFCEGYKISKNPFFNWIALNPAKGEILTLQAPDFNETRILQGGKWLFKTQCGEIKAGTTYSWDWLNETPTAPARDQIEQAIPMLTRVPYRVIKQSAGVRPVIRLDNRPIIGRHPIHHSLAILNGLGSKGVLQAPFAAEQLIMHMEKGAPIHPDFFVCRDLLWQAQRNG